jgi:hypothetical protein
LNARPEREQAVPEESRGGPINYSDAEQGDLMVAVSGISIRPVSKWQQNLANTKGKSSNG